MRSSYSKLLTFWYLFLLASAPSKAAGRGGVGSAGTGTKASSTAWVSLLSPASASLLPACAHTTLLKKRSHPRACCRGWSPWTMRESWAVVLVKCQPLILDPERGLALPHQRHLQNHAKTKINKTTIYLSASFSNHRRCFPTRPSSHWILRVNSSMVLSFCTSTGPRFHNGSRTYGDEYKTFLKLMASFLFQQKPQALRLEGQLQALGLQGPVVQRDLHELPQPFQALHLKTRHHRLHHCPTDVIRSLCTSFNQCHKPRLNLHVAGIGGVFPLQLAAHLRDGLLQVRGNEQQQVVEVHVLRGSTEGM